jgi:hypothetical protein
VYSTTNKNQKIELGAKRTVDYPTTGSPPIAVFRERQVREFDYLLLMPGEAGHAQMLRFSQTQPSIGRGLPRVLTHFVKVKRAWPGCPLLP